MVLAIVACGPAAACSLIVQFHDQPGGVCDGAVCSTDGTTVEVSVVDSGGDGTEQDTGGGPDSGNPQDSPAGDSFVAPDTFSPCMGKGNGYYCGDNGLGPGLPAGDLVNCVDGGVSTAKACDGGCLHVVDPFPDACDPCFGVANGAYCGRDLAGFPSFNADILIQCTGGKTTSQNACAHGCMSSGTMSVCYP